MAFKPDILSRKSADVDHVEKIDLPRLDRDCQILSIIEKCSLRDRFGSSRIGFVDEFWNQNLHLLMVPVRDREDELLIIFVWEVWIADDEGGSKTIWVLSLVVRMIPVTPRLGNLRAVKFYIILSTTNYLR